MGVGWRIRSGLRLVDSVAHKYVLSLFAAMGAAHQINDAYQIVFFHTNKTVGVSESIGKPTPLCVFISMSS